MGSERIEREKQIARLRWSEAATSYVFATIESGEGQFSSSIDLRDLIYKTLLIDMYLCILKPYKIDDIKVIYVILHAMYVKE